MGRKKGRPTLLYSSLERAAVTGLALTVVGQPVLSIVRVLKKVPFFPRNFALWLLLMQGLAALSVAQQSSGGNRAYALTEDVPLADALEFAANIIGVTVEYSSEQLRGKTTLRTTEGLRPEAFWRLTNRLLLSNQLACIQAPGEQGLGVVPLAQAAGLARIEPGAVEDAQAGFVKALFPVRNADLKGVAEIAQHVLSNNGSVVKAVPGASQILVAGLKPQVLEAEELVRRIDSAGSEILVESLHVAHQSPTALVTLLERVTASLKVVRGPERLGTLLADPSSSSIILVAPEDEVSWWKDLVARFDRAQESFTRHYVPRRFELDATARLVEAVADQKSPGSGWRLVEDELTGTLIVSASARQHAEIEELFQRLEASDSEPLQTVRAFPVRHRDVDTLLELLEELLHGTPTANEIPEEENATGGPVVPRLPEISLTKDEGTNRILAIGSPRALEEIGRLIEELDQKHPQVLVETLVVSLSDSQTRDLAVELQKAGVWDGSVYQLASVFGLASASPSQGSLPAAGGSGVEAAVLDPGSFSGVLRALATVNKGRSLTVPKVLVNNNETAHLNSVVQTPFATSNTSTNLATISFGGTFDAGTTVEITPQITEGDALLIEYSVSLSSFVGDSADPNLPPPRQENLLSSVVSLPDGFTAVVGGLEMETDVEARSQIPFLGSFPLIGWAFRSKSTSSTRSRFFVFIRCSVLRHAQYADLRFLSGTDAHAAGIKDLPVVEPQVIR